MRRFFVHRDDDALRWGIKIDGPMTDSDCDEEGPPGRLVFVGQADDAVERMFDALDDADDPHVLPAQSGMLHAFAPFANGWNVC